MIEELHDLLVEFVDEWATQEDETRRALVVRQSGLDYDELERIINQIQELSNYSYTGSASFEITGDSNDEYNIRFDPYEDLIHSEQDRGMSYDLEAIYGDQPELIESLQSLNNNTISTTAELKSVFSELARETSIDIDLQYSLQKSHLSDAITSELEWDSTTVSFYFYQNNFKSIFQRLDTVEIRNQVLNNGNVKALNVILDVDEYAIGDSFGASGLSRLPEISDFDDKPNDWKKDFEDIKRNSLIEQQDSTFLPPSFFRISKGTDKGYVDSIKGIFGHLIAVFSVLSLANSAEQLEEDGWKVRIKGRQFIEGEISEISTEQLMVRHEENEQTIDLDQNTVDALFELYEWTFQDQVAERITVIRNVATLYARDLAEVIIDSNKIRQSAQSNRRYYLEQNVEQFLEFRHELTDSVFQTQRDFSEIRATLTNELSRDIFRTVGFIIAIAASVFFRLEDIVPPRVAYSIIAILIIGYAGVTWHRVTGIKRQFQSMIHTQTNFMEFYERFFERSELEDLGIAAEQSIPWYARPFARKYSEQDQYVDIRAEFRFDLFLYSLLIVVMFIIGITLLIDLYAFNLINEIPITQGG